MSENRACACHPDEAPKPCQKRYAFSECQAARIEQLEAALRPLACTCSARHQVECSRGAGDCPFWNARAALEERT